MNLKTFLLGLVVTAGLPVSAMAGFQQDVVPVFIQRCVMCHIAGATQAGLDLYTSPWSAVVNVQSTQSDLMLVTPGDPGRSYLYLKLIDTHTAAGGSGLLMPIQQGALDQEQLLIIRSWIEQGAPDN